MSIKFSMSDCERLDRLGRKHIVCQRKNILNNFIFWMLPPSLAASTCGIARNGLHSSRIPPGKSHSPKNSNKHIFLIIIKRQSILQNWLLGVSLSAQCSDAEGLDPKAVCLKLLHLKLWTDDSHKSSTVYLTTQNPFNFKFQNFFALHFGSKF